MPTNLQGSASVVPRSGIATLSGYGIKVHVSRGHLILEDGIGSKRHSWRLPRVGHGLERLVVIGSDGMISLAALRWLADQNAAFVMLERDGSVLATTGPVRPSDARLRRAQARGDLSGAALVIARELIRRKLAGQEHLAREPLQKSAAAEMIAGYRSRLDHANGISDVRQLEAQAAQVYWSLWHDLPVTFPKSDLVRVPDHWCVFGTRNSPLTSSPQRAATPGNAILNYLYTVLLSESRLAIAALGLDPGLGFIHADEKIRDNLACDLMEAVRPQVDAYLLDWIRRTPLKRDWFFELRDGNCRLMGSFAVQLSETASKWRHAVAPLAEWIAHTLWASIRKPDGRRGPATRLTQRRIREARGGEPVPALKRAAEPQSFCRTCGSPVALGRKYCRECVPAFGAEQLAKAGPAGRIAGQSPNAQALRSETKRRHDAEQKAWDPASHPAWLTEEAYREKIQPLLTRISVSRISEVLTVSWAYASEIRKGRKVPHPRHWVKLAEMAGVSPRK